MAPEGDSTRKGLEFSWLSWVPGLPNHLTITLYPSWFSLISLLLKPEVEQALLTCTLDE
jgi:hypothetical protein